jgi:LytS/YehU family sensor histidine kinase
MLLGPTLIVMLQYISGLIIGIAVVFPLNLGMIPIKAFLLNWLYWLVLTIICGFLGFIFRLAFSSFQNEQLKKELEIRNHQSEIKILKSKLNPHFLFNTINNIDTLIQSRPTLASEALSKLSDILRYMVYETENEQIQIKTEIENLEKYIDLEKMRLVNPNTVSYTCAIKNDFFVPPLIFFPFVENGFKHSNLNASNQKLQISIKEDNLSLIFKCLNTINENSHESNFKGIGLELAKKRLDLLYPNRHELTINKGKNEFHVLLRIDLEL